MPTWQLNLKEHSPSEQGQNEGEQGTEVAPSRQTVIEQARRFLDEEEVRDASDDKKIAFLERKGLDVAEIQSLLGVTRNGKGINSPSKVFLPCFQSPSTRTRALSDKLPAGIRNGTFSIVTSLPTRTTRSADTVFTNVVYTTSTTNNNLSRIPHQPSPPETSHN